MTIAPGFAVLGSEHAPGVSPAQRMAVRLGPESALRGRLSTPGDWAVTLLGQACCDWIYTPREYRAKRRTGAFGGDSLRDVSAALSLHGPYAVRAGQDQAHPHGVGCHTGAWARRRSRRRFIGLRWERVRGAGTSPLNARPGIQHKPICGDDMSARPHWRVITPRRRPRPRGSRVASREVESYGFARVSSNQRSVNGIRDCARARVARRGGSCRSASWVTRRRTRPVADRRRPRAARGRTP